MSVQIHGHKFDLLISQDIIKEQVCRLGSQLENDYENKNPLFIVLLSGSFIFAADLIREVKLACEVSFAKLSSYDGTKSRGLINTAFDFSIDIAGRHVIVVEDIIDTGTTMAYYLSKLLNTEIDEAPASVKVITLLFKPSALKHSIKPDYIGFNVPNEFLVGYGLDFNQQGRNMKDIYKMNDEK